MTNTVQIKSLTFYSQNDEAQFFAWLKSISAIENVAGKGDTILATTTKIIDDNSLMELIAICQRYGVDMSQLAKYKTEENSPWFADSRMYWFDSVFSGNFDKE